MASFEKFQTNHFCLVLHIFITLLHAFNSSSSLKPDYHLSCVNLYCHRMPLQRLIIAESRTRVAYELSKLSCSLWVSLRLTCLNAPSGPISDVFESHRVIFFPLTLQPWRHILLLVLKTNFVRPLRLSQTTYIFNRAFGKIWDCPRHPTLLLPYLTPPYPS